MDSSFHRLAFLSNSRPAAEMIQPYATTMGLQIEYHFEAMEQAIKTAKTLLSTGTSLILACGTTGKMLKQKFSTSILTLQHSHLDLLKALQQASEISSVVGMPWYETIPDGLDYLARLLHIRIVPTIFNTTSSLISCINSLINEKVSCIVGSNIAVKIAKSQNIDGIEVPFNEENAYEILEYASQLLNVKKQSDISSALLTALSEASNMGIIGVGEQKNLLLWNTRATSLLRERPDSGSLPGNFLKMLGVPKVLRENEIYSRKDGDGFRIRTVPVSVNDTIVGALAMLQKEPSLAKAKQGFSSQYTLDDIAGGSQAMNNLKDRVMAYADSDASLLIRGETGTGKELLAHAIHHCSPRKDAPFVAINCAALTETLLESELFGYEEGAFTGARHGGKEGIFTLAQGGTVFLDEIADISPALQVRLLRVLESKEIMRVGGDRIIHVDVRVISSTWKDLLAEVSAGRFRADLYYRLSLLSLSAPPLRDRIEDIPLIVEKIIRRNGLSNIKFTEDDFIRMKNYTWPGNIRELTAYVQRCSILSSHSYSRNKNIYRNILEEIIHESEHIFKNSKYTDEGIQKNHEPIIEQCSPENTSLKKQTEAYELSIINKALSRNGYNHKKAAKELGISINTLWRKINKKQS